MLIYIKHLFYVAELTIKIVLINFFKLVNHKKINL